ncbi:amino acid ABC transporter permease [Enterococcus mediterraneensis]|uniref:amino acid ABC transporter permease n=1 Tax=Enterococcus mediterraneensis TaxID=2364791 RepID=UPI000F062A2B|nr:amino acid ABC transporter permease [Enterococcus mediterraneensis]
MDRIQEIVINAAGPIFLAGLKVTIPLTLVSFVLGLVFATLTAIGRLSKSKILNNIFAFYVWLFRGTPLLVQLFIAFYGLAQIGIELDKWFAAALTLSLNTGAYASEPIRSAILAIPKGQWEAAQAIGMDQKTLLRRIIAPQAVRICLPPLSNTFISLVKDTSLASTITVTEMFMVSQRIAARFYEPLTLYIEVAVFYLLFCTVLTLLQSQLEKWTSRYTVIS